MIASDGNEYRICGECSTLIYRDEDKWRDSEGFDSSGPSSGPFKFHFHTPAEEWRSNKFMSEESEIFYGFTLNSGQDDDFGNTDFGNYFLFRDELAILIEDVIGFVYINRYDTASEMMESWNAEMSEWDAYSGEEETAEASHYLDDYDEE